jgi:ribosomal protein S12 methylthiotransferase
MSGRSVHLVSLGCPKNRVDSESMLGQLVSRGWQVVDEPDQADVLVVNTCAFIQPATEESIETVLELAGARHAHQRLVVTGCMVQRYGEELAQELPEVDAFLGTGELWRLASLVEGEERELALGEAGWLEQAPVPRAGLWRPHSAYLKITEGCHQRCSYCIIPTLRGPLRSRALSPLLEEAASLAEQGVREICLVGQDTTAWGRDLADRPGLASLLHGLATLEGIEWIRVLYAHPRGVDDALLDAMAAHPAICGYLDLPLQHVASPVLRAMGRGMDRASIESLIARIRERVPGIVLRSTFMVGFPGERAEDFEALLDFVGEQRLERAGVFRYYAEEGTRAASLPDRIPPELQQERFERLIDAQAAAARAYHASLVGQRLMVMVDGPSDQHELMLVGRHAGQAPEIDGVVHLGAPPESVRPGSMVEAVVSDADEVDLAAEPVLDASAAPPRGRG